MREAVLFRVSLFHRPETFHFLYRQRRRKSSTWHIWLEGDFIAIMSDSILLINCLLALTVFAQIWIPACSIHLRNRDWNVQMQNTLKDKICTRLDIDPAFVEGNPVGMLVVYPSTMSVSPPHLHHPHVHVFLRADWRAALTSRLLLWSCKFRARVQRHQPV